MLTLLEKRLIAMSHLGIRIEHGDNHRWILATETENFDFNFILDKKYTDFCCKVYGGINEALDRIDSVLYFTFYQSLENTFNTIIQLDLDEYAEDDIINIKG